MKCIWDGPAAIKCVEADAFAPRGERLDRFPLAPPPALLAFRSPPYVSHLVKLDIPILT